MDVTHEAPIGTVIQPTNTPHGKSNRNFNSRMKNLLFFPFPSWEAPTFCRRMGQNTQTSLKPTQLPWNVQRIPSSFPGAEKVTLAEPWQWGQREIRYLPRARGQLLCQEVPKNAGRHLMAQSCSSRAHANLSFWLSQCSISPLTSESLPGLTLTDQGYFDFAFSLWAVLLRNYFSDYLHFLQYFSSLHSLFFHARKQIADPLGF